MNDVSSKLLREQRYMIFVDVLIAQQQLYLAQREYARARHAFLVNTLRLRQAAGVLELGDVQNVNRSLSVDAEAALINN